MPLGDRIHRINLISPPVVLHTLGVGIVKYIMQNINECMTDTEQSVLDMLHAQIYYDLKHNSDQTIMQARFTRGTQTTHTRCTREY